MMKVWGSLLAITRSSLGPLVFAVDMCLIHCSEIACSLPMNEMQQPACVLSRARSNPVNPEWHLETLLTWWVMWKGRILFKKTIWMGDLLICMVYSLMESRH